MIQFIGLMLIGEIMGIADEKKRCSTCDTMRTANGLCQRKNETCPNR
jgi:hypothetical protein